MQFLRRAAVAIVLMLLATLPTAAQNYRWDFNVNGGGTWFTKLLKNTDIFNDIDENDELFNNDFGSVKLGGNWIVGSQLGFWFTPNIGIRANGAYTDTDLGNNVDLFDDINVWNGTGDLMYRFIRPRRRWEGFEILPYIAGGLGATWVNPAGDHFVEIDNVNLTTDEERFVFEGRSGVPIVCTLATCFGPGTAGFPGLDTLVNFERGFFLREASRFTGLVALGADFRVAPPFAIRVEVGDRIWKAPVDEIAPIEGFTRTVLRVSEDVGKTVHQFYAIGGLNFLFGLERPKPVAVVPVPAPPPPPPPPPAPEAVTVCVIDERSEEGLQMVTAYRLRTTGDTVVVVNGDTVELANAIRPTMLATDADWYIRGAPLEIGTAPRRVAFTPVGGARMIEPMDLVYIGRVNGMPVYIDRASATGPLMNFGPMTDLSREMSTNAEARAALEKVNVIYVPLQTVGCIFQGLQRQEEVRKK